VVQKGKKKENRPSSQDQRSSLKENAMAVERSDTQGRDVLRTRVVITRTEGPRRKPASATTVERKDTSKGTAGQSTVNRRRENMQTLLETRRTEERLLSELGTSTVSIVWKSIIQRKKDRSNPTRCASESMTISSMTSTKRQLENKATTRTIQSGKSTLKIRKK
jgi:hypothetical protein